MYRRIAFAVLAVPLFLPLNATAQQPAPTQKESGAAAMLEVTASTLKWEPVKVTGFLPGAELTVVSGDPGKEEAYTMRLRFPAGYRFPAHYHPKLENLTVISGTFLLGMGDKTDESKLKKYAPGDYLQLPGKMPHFGGAEGETLIQLHGIGPFDITAVEQLPGAMK